jgi:serine/threonine-protein kinase
MNEPHDANRTVDVPSTPADSLDAGLAAGFGPPRSSLGDMRPPLLKEAESESAHIVQPKSDAMPAPEQTGDRYQLQGEIARGGMGAVLRGRDVDLGRDLAVKVLLEKYVHRPEVARRFIEEAQIGGQLQHPGVVPVYDIGRFGERPFFTMKLVKGKTLGALLGERSTPALDALGSPSDLARFLDIALKVAQTLAYAHAKGVIHRDLKPANVMVGAFGEVQVMDWGLAKVLTEGGIADEERASRERDMGSRVRERPEVITTIRTARSIGSADTFGTATEAGSLLGTPAYMPPEQANGDIARLDRRADVFGLGAILCEILTSKPPYVGRSAEEVRRKACNGDQVDTQARLDTCGADQGLIALTKACLSPEAIDRPKDAQAVADGLTAYLGGVQERLHQAELAEAEARARAIEEAKRRRLTVALAGTVLLALTVGGGGWLWIKTDREARQAQVAREVNEALNKATALREQARTATTGGAAMFAQAREQAQRALALVDNSAVDPAQADQVRQLQTELDEEEKDRTLVDALDEARLAQAETVAGEGRFAKERAVPKFRAAFQAYGLEAGKGERAAADRIRGRPRAVRAAIVAALDEWDSLTTGITEPHRMWLRAVLEQAEPDDAWGRQVWAARRETDPAKRRAALERLADSARVADLPPRALTQLSGHLRLARAAALLRQAQRHYPADFWVNHDLGMALLLVTPPKRDEAVRFLTAAVALRPDSPGCRLDQGAALYLKGRLDEAIACYQKASALAPKYAAPQYNLGLALYHKGQLDEAIACYQRAIALDPKYAVAHSNLGAALRAKGQLDEAIACYRKAVALDPMLTGAHTNLGAALTARGQLPEAIACSRKAVALDPKYAVAHHNLGAALAERGQLDEAIACYQRAISLDPKLARPHSGLGSALTAKGQLDEAIACCRKAVALDPNLATAHYHLGAALTAKGQLDEAIASSRKATLLDPKLADAHYNLGAALYGKGLVDQALGWYRRAIALNPKIAIAHGALGQALIEKGQFAEARDATARALDLIAEDDPRRALASQQMETCQRFLQLEGRLPRLLRGEEHAGSAGENLAVATLCRFKQMHAAAAGFAAAAFAADPRLADDPRAGTRYAAARDAARAAAGKGKDASRLDANERARLRRQALEWLRADLAMLTRVLKGGPPTARTAVRRTLKQWQKDGDLDSIRERAELAKLSAEDRAAFAKLWNDVAGFLKSIEPLPAKEPQR